MDIFLKIIETIVYVLFGMLGIAFTYADKISPKWLRIYARICAIYVFIAGPLLVWGFLSEV